MGNHPLYRDDVIRRFWAKVTLPADSSDPAACWLWTGAQSTGAHKWLVYGSAWDGSRVRTAHILAWEIHYREAVPPGMQVRHVVCRRPLCVRPDHLAVGTRQDNMDDMVRDGRSRRGETHRAAHFTRDDVRAIRASPEPAKVIAGRYGVRSSTIINIRARRSWAWLE